LGSSTVTIGYILFFILIFYFLLIRPQQKQKKQKNDMLSNLSVNDEIFTIGGIVGKISKINENTLKIKIAPDVEIEMLKTSIAGKRTKEDKS